MTESFRPMQQTIDTSRLKKQGRITLYRVNSLEFITALVEINRST